MANIFPLFGTILGQNHKGSEKVLKLLVFLNSNLYIETLSNVFF